MKKAVLIYSSMNIDNIIHNKEYLDFDIINAIKFEEKNRELNTKNIEILRKSDFDMLIMAEGMHDDFYETELYDVWKNSLLAGKEKNAEIITLAPVWGKKSHNWLTENNIEILSYTKSKSELTEYLFNNKDNYIRYYKRGSYNSGVPKEIPKIKKIGIFSLDNNENEMDFIIKLCSNEKLKKESKVIMDCEYGFLFDFDQTKYLPLDHNSFWEYLENQIIEASREKYKYVLFACNFNELVADGNDTKAKIFNLSKLVGLLPDEAVLIIERNETEEKIEKALLAMELFAMIEKPFAIVIKNGKEQDRETYKDKYGTDIFLDNEYEKIIELMTSESIAGIISERREFQIKKGKK